MAIWDVDMVTVSTLFYTTQSSSLTPGDLSVRCRRTDLFVAAAGLMLGPGLDARRRVAVVHPVPLNAHGAAAGPVAGVGQGADPRLHPADVWRSHSTHLDLVHRQL